MPTSCRTRVGPAGRASLNRILDLAVPEFRLEGGTMIVPGHGRLCDAADVAYYRDMVTVLRDRVQDQLRKGQVQQDLNRLRQQQFNQR